MLTKSLIDKSFYEGFQVVPVQPEAVRKVLFNVTCWSGWLSDECLMLSIQRQNKGITVANSKISPKRLSLQGLFSLTMQGKV